MKLIFDIQGGGAGIFLHDKLVFPLFFAQQVIFSKSKLQQFFLYFLKINTVNSGKCKLNQHIE